MVAMNVWPTDAADGSVASEARWRKMGRLWTPSAVMMGAGGDMVPSLAGTNLTVKAGAAWVDGHYCELLGDQVLTVSANGLAVVRFDPAANTAELLWRDGASTPAQSPTGTWELPIAKVAGSVLTDVRPQWSGQVLIFPGNVGRDLWTSRPVGAQCMTADTGWTWTYRGAIGWIPDAASYSSAQTSMGGFPAAGYTWPAADTNIATYLAANQLLPGGLTAWAGLWTVTCQVEIAPTDAGDLTVRLINDAVSGAGTAAMAFGVISFQHSWGIAAGKELKWRMYKGANTAGWTGSWVRFAVDYRYA